MRCDIVVVSSLFYVRLVWGMGYIHIHGKIVIARPRGRCVLESSNGVGGGVSRRQTISRPALAPPHPLFGLGIIELCYKTERLNLLMRRMRYSHSVWRGGSLIIAIMSIVIWGSVTLIVQSEDLCHILIVC